VKLQNNNEQKVSAQTKDWKLAEKYIRKLIRDSLDRVHRLLYMQLQSNEWRSTEIAIQRMGINATHDFFPEIVEKAYGLLTLAENDLSEQALRIELWLEELSKLKRQLKKTKMETEPK
jgi:hypothetical protein